MTLNAQYSIPHTTSFTIYSGSQATQQFQGMDDLPCLFLARPSIPVRWAMSINPVMANLFSRWAVFLSLFGNIALHVILMTGWISLDILKRRLRKLKSYT